MKIHLLAVGHMKGSGVEPLCALYAKRIRWPLRIQEVVVRKKALPDQIKREECAMLLAEIPDNRVVISLDEKGDNLSSQAFATMLQAFSIQGDSSMTFVIGGANGLTEELRQRSNRLISLGRMTWPHMMARVMVLEQLYRAQQILAGHPYHREG